jgi:adenosylcobinamide-GDP ribazoletransferase
MVLSALRGGFGFLTRIPLGHDEDAWAAFTQTPATFPVVGYVVGALVAIPLVVPLPAPSNALAFVLGIYLVTGITHLDGVADLGDAVAAHGVATDRQDVMQDTAIGTGGALAVALVVLGLGTAGLELASGSRTALAVVVIAEVGAKAAVATLVCLGSATHEGLGSALTEGTAPRSLGVVGALAVPAVALSWPRPAIGVATLSGAIVGGLTVFLWARSRLGGVSGDVFGATNEIARVTALHLGVITWTLY